MLKQWEIDIVISMVIGAILFFIVIWNWCRQEYDHIAEEVIERIIETQTGINLDLSPTTPEG